MNIDLDFFISAALILGIIGLAFKAGDWYGTVNRGMKDLGDKISKLSERVDAVSERVDVLSKTVNSLAETVSKLSERMDELFETVGKLSERVGKGDSSSDQNSIVETKSPLQLNELGRTISKDIDSDNLAKKYLSNIKTNTDETEYWIQKRCFEYARDTLPEIIDEQERKSMEQVSFNRGVHIDTVFAVMGVVFRNAKFDELGIALNKGKTKSSAKTRTRVAPRAKAKTRTRVAPRAKAKTSR